MIDSILPVADQYWKLFDEAIASPEVQKKFNRSAKKLSNMSVFDERFFDTFEECLCEIVDYANDFAQKGIGLTQDDIEEYEYIWWEAHDDKTFSANIEARDEQIKNRIKASVVLTA